jgi:Choline/ethanolamine kinase
MPQYTYVKIRGKVYLCLQQNLAVLAWLLAIKGRPLGFGRESLMTTFESPWLLASWLTNLLRYQFHLWNNDSRLELPFYGNVCLLVNRGYKIFDLQRERVIKIFKEDVDTSSIKSEIERVRNVGRYDFAPVVRRWDIEARWYEEDYVNGSPITAADMKTYSKNYYQYAASCIESMIFCEGLQVTNVAEYVNHMMAMFLGRLLGDGSDMSSVRPIQDFMHMLADDLCNAGDLMVHLVLSHGDFDHCPVLRTKQGIKVIDWEYMAHRSILFDLYNYFMVQLFWTHRVPNLVSEIESALSSLQVRLALRAPEVAESLRPLARVYRWLYYIERICSVVEVRGRDVKCMRRWMDSFNDYEEMVAGVSSAGQPAAPARHRLARWRAR